MLIEQNLYYIVDGEVVRVQEERDGRLSAYNASGERVHSGKSDEHVHGWEPCSENTWIEARAALKSKTSSKKKAKKEKEK